MNPVSLQPTKLQLLEITILGHMTPQGHMTIISQTVRDKAKRSKFSNPVGLKIDHFDFGDTRV